jgi:hypothetical protein
MKWILIYPTPSLFSLLRLIPCIFILALYTLGKSRWLPTCTRVAVGIDISKREEMKRDGPGWVPSDVAARSRGAAASLLLAGVVVAGVVGLVFGLVQFADVRRERADERRDEASVRRRRILVIGRITLAVVVVVREVFRNQAHGFSPAPILSVTASRKLKQLENTNDVPFRQDSGMTMTSTP